MSKSIGFTHHNSRVAWLERHGKEIICSAPYSVTGALTRGFFKQYPVIINYQFSSGAKVNRSQHDEICLFGH